MEGKKLVTAKVTSGIRQGSVLGPILILVFINDIQSVSRVLKKLFADDAKLYQVVTVVLEVTLVQAGINNSVDWSEIWHMSFNFKKCKHMHIGSHDLNQIYPMKEGQELIPIEKVDSENDLDVIIDKDLTFTENIN